MRSPNYELQTGPSRFVDLALHFHHLRIHKMFSTLATDFDLPGSLVLEIGGGTKSRREHFRKAAFVSIDFVARAGVDFVEDATNLALRDQIADLVLCENVIEHVEEPQRALEEIRRTLRPQGALFLVTPFLFPLHDVPHDFFRYTEHSLRYLMRDYSELRISQFLWLPMPGSFFKRFVLYYVCIARR